MKSYGIFCSIVSVAAFAVMSLAAANAYSGERETLPGVAGVPDTELSQMRGKYVASTTQVVYFGVTLQSSWQTPDGSSLDAGARVVMDVTGATPSVGFSPSASIDPGSGDGSAYTDTTGREVTRSGIDNVSGVTQSVQIVGDNNATHNLVRIKFLSDIPADVAIERDISNDAFASSNDSGIGMSAYSGLDGNAVVVKLQVDGQGMAEQSIRGSVRGAAGEGVHQSIVSLGDWHRITNQLEMNVVVRSESTSRVLQQGLGTALGNLRGVTPNL